VSRAPTSPTAIKDYVYWPFSAQARLEEQGFQKHGKSWFRCLNVDLTPTGYRAEWEVMFATRRGLAKRINVYTHPENRHDPLKPFGDQPFMDPHSSSFVSRDGTITPAAHRNGRRG